MTASVPTIGLPVDHITLPSVVAMVPVDNLPVEEVTLPAPVVSVPTSELSDISIDVTLPPLRAGVPGSFIGDYLPEEISLSVVIPPYEPIIRIVDISTLLGEYITLPPLTAEIPTMALSTISLPDIRLPRPNVPPAGSGIVQLSDVLDDYLSMSSEWVLPAEEGNELPQFREPYEVLLRVDNPGNDDVSFFIRADDLNEVIPGSIVNDSPYTDYNKEGGGVFEVNLPVSPMVSVEALKLDWADYVAGGPGMSVGTFDIDPANITTVLIKYSSRMEGVQMAIEVSVSGTPSNPGVVLPYSFWPSFIEGSEGCQVQHADIGILAKFTIGTDAPVSELPPAFRDLVDNSIQITQLRYPRAQINHLAFTTTPLN